LHVIVFPAAVKAGLAVTARLAMLGDGYVTVHCTPAGSLPAGEFTDKVKEVVPGVEEGVEVSETED
jgi:hypothetical protein